MSKLVVLFTIFNFSTTLQAQQIIGFVSDCISGKAIEGVHAILIDGSVCVTNNKGYFTCKIKAGEIIELSHLGFKKLKFEIKSTFTDTIKICLQPSSVEIKQVIITAAKDNRLLMEIPARVAIVTGDDLSQAPILNADDFLKQIATLRVDRDKGIFSKNSTVTGRGLNGSQRMLILVDGAPVLKADGGGINWNRISQESIDRIELIKGPGSSLYGGNAMGGVINVITKTPQKDFELSSKLSFGSFNTFAGTAYVGGSKINENKGFYWTLNGFYRKSDGYIFAPDSIRDSIDVPAYLTEYIGNARLGYRFNRRSKVELEHCYSFDKRGDGVQVFDPDGGYTLYSTHYTRARYNYSGDRTRIETNAFFQREYYENQKESAKFDVIFPYSLTKYQLYQVQSVKTDIGLWSSATRNISETQIVTCGLDFRSGAVKSADVYFTSTDTVNNLGRLYFAAAFVQHEWLLLNKKIRIVSGLRFDWAAFSDAEFNIKSGSVTSGLLVNYSKKYNDTSWYAISPKLALQYNVNDSNFIFLSYGRGFRPPMLDDMIRNGSVNKGLKLANPTLKPELLDNVELGATLQLMYNIEVEPSVYYSRGKGFMYYVGTGDTVDWNTSVKPVIRRENISGVEIYGAEISVKWKPFKSLFLRAAYSYNHSVVSSFNLNNRVGKDLTGKYLMEVPPQIYSASIVWTNKYFNSAINYAFLDKYWSDDENTVQIKKHFTVDAKISKSIYNDKIKLALSVMNLTNEVFLDNKNLMGMPRFVVFEIAYKY